MNRKERLRRFKMAKRLISRGQYPTLACRKAGIHFMTFKMFDKKVGAEKLLARVWKSDLTVKDKKEIEKRLGI